MGIEQRAEGREASRSAAKIPLCSEAIRRESKGQREIKTASLGVEMAEGQKGGKAERKYQNVETASLCAKKADGNDGLEYESIQIY